MGQEVKKPPGKTAKGRKVIIP